MLLSQSSPLYPNFPHLRATTSTPHPTRHPTHPALSSLQNVVDGDLCETFASLSAARQKAVAGDLDRTPQDVLKKLEDVRNKVL